MKVPLTLTINGAAREELVEPRTSLLTFLREQCGLLGSKRGCEEGECGACSVILAGRLVPSCLLFAVEAEGAAVTTVEGLAQDGGLSPIQEAFVKHYALQCGYCTSGMLLASHALLTRNPDPSEEEIRRRLSGNLCMCTGYTQIVDAVKAAAKEYRKG